MGTGNRGATDEMSDVLAQVATNTEHKRTAGNAVLYESVHTIMSIDAEQGLKVLAINILGRFLMSKDNNVRCGFRLPFLSKYRQSFYPPS